MLNITCAMSSVTNPRVKWSVTNRASNDDPRTISGAEMFMNMTTSNPACPRNRYRTSASPIKVPRTVATTVLAAASPIETFNALVRSVTSKVCSHQ